LAGGAASFPPIEFVSRVPADVSAAAEAFVRINDTRIDVVTSSPLFTRLQRVADRCGDLTAARKLASVLVHEELHVRHAADEAAAYAAQLTTLASLGAGPGSPLYSEVHRSMMYTLSRPRAKLERIMVVR